MDKVAYRKVLPIPDKFSGDGKRLVSYQRGHHLLLEVSTQCGTKTRVYLFAQRPDVVNTPKKEVESSSSDSRDPTVILSSIVWRYELKSDIGVQLHGETFFYEQLGVETDVNYLTFVVDILLNLADAYPKLIEQAGEVVPFLCTFMSHKSAVAIRPVIFQILTEIEEITKERCEDKCDELLCRNCFVYCTTSTVYIPDVKKITYYGCRACGQSRDFIKWNGKIIAVLDDRMGDKLFQTQNGVLRVNWLKHRRIFDFDEVEVIRATEEEVERLAIQIGNDMDVARASRYEQMCCRVSVDCDLSPSALRILKHVFAGIKINE